MKARIKYFPYMTNNPMNSSCFISSIYHLYGLEEHSIIQLLCGFEESESARQGLCLSLGGKGYDGHGEGPNEQVRSLWN